MTEPGEEPKHTINRRSFLTQQVPAAAAAAFGLRKRELQPTPGREVKPEEQTVVNEIRSVAKDTFVPFSEAANNPNILNREEAAFIGLKFPYLTHNIEVAPLDRNSLAEAGITWVKEATDKYVETAYARIGNTIPTDLDHKVIAVNENSGEGADGYHLLIIPDPKLGSTRTTVTLSAPKLTSAWIEAVSGAGVPTNAPFSNQEVWSKCVDEFLENYSSSIDIVGGAGQQPPAPKFDFA